MLGFEDENIYAVTEGWPLGIRSFRVLFEDGVNLVDIPAQGSNILDSYLFYECAGRLPVETIDFLKASACFEELDPQMLDAVTNRKNSLLLLDSLVNANIFTTRDGRRTIPLPHTFQAALVKRYGGFPKKAAGAQGWIILL